MIDELCDRLVSEHPSTGDVAARNVRLWLSGTVPLVDVDELTVFLTGAPLELVHDCFWRNLPFGTGGIRGTVGFGPNRINDTVVSTAIQAHCELMTRQFPDAESRRIVIANDVRSFRDQAKVLEFMPGEPGRRSSLHQKGSRDLALLAAEVYAGNGFEVFLQEPENTRPPEDGGAILTTPELSFLIRRLGALGGINLSASHNPPDDNGVKVYDSEGGQYLPPYDEELTNLAADIATVERTPYAEALEQGLVNPVPEADLAAYVALYDDLMQLHQLSADGSTPIVYTPLSGCGDRTLGAGLRRAGFDIRFRPDQVIDPTFAHIPLLAPNPEVIEATGPARDFATEVGSAIVISSDPDADRLGAEVFHQGAWRHLTGNQLSTLLAYYLLLDPRGPQLRGGVYTTNVTTPAVVEIATRAAVDHVVGDLLIGFKYIGAAVQDYDGERTSTSDEGLLTYATEESHGFLMTPHIRDKDSMSGGLHLASLHETLTAEGRTLVDYLDDVYREIGEFGATGRSILSRGSEGVSMIAGIMSSLRDAPPSELLGVEVVKFDDRWDQRPAPDGHGEFVSSTNREARNILGFDLADGTRVVVRPSGTEPKLKFYVHTSGDAAQADADARAVLLYRDLCTLAGKDLQTVFAQLPDVMSVGEKLQVQDVVTPALVERLSAGDAADDVRAWLDEQLSSLVQGSNPLKAVRPVLLEATAELGDDERARLDDVFGPAAR